MPDRDAKDDPPLAGPMVTPWSLRVLVHDHSEQEVIFDLDVEGTYAQGLQAVVDALVKVMPVLNAPPEAPDA